MSRADWLQTDDATDWAIVWLLFTPYSLALKFGAPRWVRAIAMFGGVPWAFALMPVALWFPAAAIVKDIWREL